MALSGVSAGAIGVMLVIALVCDVRSRTIPGLLTFGGIGAGLIAAPLLHGGLLTGIVGAAAAFGAVALFVWRGLLGEGDALLLAAIGAWSNWQFALTAILWTSLVGAALALGLLLVKRRHDWSREYPYVPAIAVGTLLAAVVR